MHKRVEKEIEDFVRSKAPGMTVTFQDNPALDSVTLGLGVVIELKRLKSNRTSDQEFGFEVMDMLAEVQKAAVTAIGLEEYIRERELAVLDRLAERIETRFEDGDPIAAIREELGGN